MADLRSVTEQDVRDMERKVRADLEARRCVCGHASGSHEYHVGICTAPRCRPAKCVRFIAKAGW